MHIHSNQFSDKERSSIVHKVTLYGMVMDIFLTIVKILVGVMYRSPALIADGIHSLSDMITDIFVLIINKFAHEEPDESHPYGHARFETLGTAILGAALIGVGIGMGIEYVQQLISQQSTAQPSYWAIAVVLCSLVGKEWQFRFTMAAAKKVNSPMLEANAWHSRTDAFSSLIVLFGVIATFLGYPLVESIAALAVALMIGKMGFSLSWEALEQLLDKGLSREQHDACIEALQNTPGVLSVHMLRGRSMSHQIFIDVHIQVDDDISISEGHQIGELAMANVKERIQDIKDITLHIDYEADDELCFIKFAPLRPDIETEISRYSLLNQHKKMLIHYHKQRVTLELHFSEDITDTQALEAERQAFIDEKDWLKDIQCFHVNRLH